MTRKLNWFSVKLALSGVSEKDVSEVIQDLRDELKTRSHLRNPQVFWEEGAYRIIVQVENESLNSKTASEGVAEELLEITVAVVREFKRIHVEILDTGLIG